VILEEPVQVLKSILETLPKPTSLLVTLAHETLPADEPAFKNFPLLEVPVAGICKLPSPDGWT